jgi:2-oxoglutarate/2-oxoacid ferredoxin oxidoreductase subunit alpha
VLSDGYLANSTEPWRLPDAADLPDISVTFAAPGVDGEPFAPYARDPETLARPWAVPGTPGLEHRVGGLEKADGSGNISYDPENHERMTHLRAAKIAGIAHDVEPLELDDPGGLGAADLLVLGWGGTFGVLSAAVKKARAGGLRVAMAHLVHLNPFPANTGEIVRAYPKVLVPELNMGQLSRLIRAEYLVDARSFTKVQGAPFRTTEIIEAIEATLAAKGASE